ncbi:MAG: PDZ domain-containing protein [Deltaproteobacteria bacterium]|nr:PDZ domain-containing protein [Deltaproteobacteria bacterium]
MRSTLSSLAVSATVILLAASLASCAYPRRTTSLSPVRTASAMTTGPGGTPGDVFRFTAVSATLNAQNRGATQWDDNGGLPDPVLRVYRDDALVWESGTVNDSLHPEWNEAAPRNIRFPSSARIRIEVWDDDELGGDPVGIWRGIGLPPNARSGVDARILLEGESYVTVRVDPPQPHRGVGVRLFEVHGSDLQIVEVEPFSPAARADLVPGDRILAIGGQTVSQLGSQRAAGALSMAAERQEALRVANAQGAERTVTLDRGYVWLIL